MNHIGEYPLEWFTSKPLPSFTCGICFDVLKNPHQCQGDIKVHGKTHNVLLTCNSSTSHISTLITWSNQVDFMGSLVVTVVTFGLISKNTSKSYGLYAAVTGMLLSFAPVLYCPLKYPPIVRAKYDQSTK